MDLKDRAPPTPRKAGPPQWWPVGACPSPPSLRLAAVTSRLGREGRWHPSTSLPRRLARTRGQADGRADKRADRRADGRSAGRCSCSARPRLMASPAPPAADELPGPAARRLYSR